MAAFQASQGPVPSSLLLPGTPWAFTQDDLLTTDQFIRKAEPLGLRVRREDLRRLHEERKLVPLLTIVDEVERSQVVPSAIGSTSWTYLNAVSVAAREGRLRDPWTSGTVPDYERPASEDDRRWWDGLLWSSWQLLDLYDVENVPTPVDVSLAARRRTRTIVLCALSARHLPDVRGQASLPVGLGWDELRSLRSVLPGTAAIGALGIDAGLLREEAESLLLLAHSRDPLRDWLPLVRRTDSAAWDRLRGSAAQAIQLRLAAEVLLRTHEELVEEGEIEALPDFSASRGWHPLRDRIAVQRSDVRPLDDILADFGLVSRPRLLLLVEGETELLQVPLLITTFSDPRPEFIRVQRLGGVDVNPQLLARYVVTPRIGQRLGDGWMLNAPLTALMIAVDEEGSYATEEKRVRLVRRIREGIRHETVLQGGGIDDEALEFLVQVRTWGPSGCYELANFDDDDLVDALSTGGTDDESTSLPSRDAIRDLLVEVRHGQRKLDVVVGRCRTTKPDLANRLWPVLRAKAELEIESGVLVTPVVRVVADAEEMALRVHPRVRALRDPGSKSNEQVPDPIDDR